MLDELPRRCPSCGKTEWEDLDMDTGETFCTYCGEFVSGDEEDIDEC